MQLNKNSLHSFFHVFTFQLKPLLQHVLISAILRDYNTQVSVLFMSTIVPIFLRLHWQLEIQSQSFLLNIILLSATVHADYSHLISVSDCKQVALCCKPGINLQSRSKSRGSRDLARLLSHPGMLLVRPNSSQQHYNTAGYRCW